MKPAIILEPAKYEMADAVFFYNEQVAGLGDEWLEEFERALAHIVRYPESATLTHGNIRRHLLRRFPYAVLYRDEAPHIAVLVVMHQHRKPYYWKQRL